jgi:Family of unknown function (DUF6151)
MTADSNLSCACGQVRLQVENAPIVSVGCCCNSCRTAGARLQALAGAPHILSEHGATPFVLYRKDRVRFMQGTQHLRELHLSDKSPTRRVVATCCNTPVFLEFKHGHWLSLYTCIWHDSKPPELEMLTMTGDLPDPSVLPNNVPNAKRQSGAFFVRLFKAWVAMGFKSPKLQTYGVLHA